MRHTLFAMAALCASTTAVAREPAEEEPAPIGLTVGAWVGSGTVREQETGSNGTLGVDATATFDLPFDLRITAGFGDRVQDQVYLSSHADPEVGGLQRVTVREQVIDAALGVDVDLAPQLPLPSEDSAHVWVGLAPRVVVFDNTSFANWAGSLRLSCAVEVAVAGPLSLRGHLGWGPRLFGTPETLSVLGLPRSFWDAHAGAGLRFGDRVEWTLTGGWTLDAVVFDRTTRVRHLAMAGLMVSL